MLTLGVDIDSYAIHVCAIPADGGPPTAVSHGIRKKGDDEHRAIGAVSFAFATAVNQIRRSFPSTPYTAGDGTVVGYMHPTVDGVWVERGYGANRNADFILGCIYGAVIVASGHALPGVAVRQMKASQWKRHVTGERGVVTKKGGVGNGNAPKALANTVCTEIWLERWPAVYPPVDPNQLDAFGVALTATTL